MFRRFFAVGVAIFIQSISIWCKSCEKYTIHDFSPLKIGYKWVYQVFPLFMIGDSAAPDFYLDSICITDSFSWKGKNGYKGIDFGIEKYWLFTNNELREYLDFPTDTLEYSILLKVPLKVGNEWFHMEDKRFKVISRIEEENTSLSLPAGKFNNCLKVSSVKGERWYTPRVGFVKYHLCMITFELIRHELE